MIDSAEIKIKAGNGGDGKVSFRREKFIPRGGPDGGDGGNGGSVIFIGDTNMATLADFRAKKSYFATSGGAGGKKKMSGECASDLYIKLPLGTLIFEKKSDRDVLVGDITKDGQEILAARGGIGGKGNFHFKSSTNRTPMQFTPGTIGEEKVVRLEIKVLADIGLVGFPNAGKSTLINKLTNSNAKVANYPFTTISPNLGVCHLKDGRDVVIADIPGLIEGASIGKGLGDEFLKHIERTRFIMHIIDPLTDLELNIEQKDYSKMIAKNSLEKYETIRNELSSYGSNLDKKYEIVLINKIDVTEVKNSLDEINSVFSKKGINVLGISAVSGEGIEELLKVVSENLDKYKRIDSFDVAEVVKIYTLDNLPNKRMVFDDSRVVSI